MITYDSEDLMTDVLALMQSKLNAKIASVEAEKIAKGLPDTGLQPIAATGYFEQNWGDKNLNINPAIWYGIEQVLSEGIGPATAVTYRIFVDILLIDSGMDTLTKNRIHRYSRALKEVFEENWDRVFKQANVIKIETVRPIEFKLEENTSETYKVGGIAITTTLA